MGRQGEGCLRLPWLSPGQALSRVKAEAGGVGLVGVVGDVLPPLKPSLLLGRDLPPIIMCLEAAQNPP